MILALLALLACAGAPSDSGVGPADTPDPVVCGEHYRQSDLAADLRGAYCEWAVDCLGIWGDVSTCGSLYTDESILEDIDPCRLQTCVAWLTGDTYVCETEEAVATPDECGDPYWQDGKPGR